MANTEIEIFYSYSHRDEKLRDSLETHLSILKRQNLIKDWHDRKILPSEEWKSTIDGRIEKADIILLLVSSDFIASDYCYCNELNRALENHDIGKSRVVPIIIRPVEWGETPFAKLQALPKDGKPVTTWPNTDEAWLNVVKGLRRIIDEISLEKNLINKENSLYSLSELIDADLDRMEETYSNKGVSGYSTGLIGLDEFTDGVHKTDIFLFGGRPLSGKTDLVLNISHRLALTEKIPVAFFSMRVSPDQIYRRLLASQSKVSLHRMNRSIITLDSWASLTEAASILFELPFTIDGSPLLTLNGLLQRLEIINKKSGVGLIVIDGIEHLVSDDRKRTREAEITSIIHSLKEIVIHYEAPVLLTVHLTRQLDQRVDKRPMLKDLDEWELLSSDASDAVIFLYRDELYNPDSLSKGTAELIIAKNNYGPTGYKNLAYLREFCMFSNLAKEDI